MQLNIQFYIITPVRMLLYTLLLYVYELEVATIKNDTHLMV